MIRPTHPDGTPLTIREQLERAGLKKAKRAAKALYLWPKRGMDATPGVRKSPRTPTARQRLRARLDALWSLVVRKRDAMRTGGLCRICGVRQIEVGYHLIPRGSDATRWDLENGIGACHNCNRGEQLNRLKYRQKHVELFGAALIEKLEAKARTLAKYSMADLEEILRALTYQLTRLR